MTRTAIHRTPWTMGTHALVVATLLACGAACASPPAPVAADARRDPGALEFLEHATPERIESQTTQILYRGVAQNGPIEPRSYDACIGANLSHCLFSYYSLVNLDGTHAPYVSSNPPSDGFSNLYLTPPARSLVINANSRRLKVFSEPNYKGKCRIVGVHKAPYPIVYDSIAYPVVSAKTIAGDVTQTPDCPKL